MKEKEMVEETEGNRMMDVSEMLNLAKALYTSQVIENLWHEHYSKIWRRQIERELKRLGIKNDSEKEKIKLDSRLVDVIIQDIMYEYFLGYVYNDEENGYNYKDAAMQRHKRYKEEIQKRQEERLKTLQEASRAYDKKLNEQSQEMAEEYRSELITRQELENENGCADDGEGQWCYRRVTSNEEAEKEKEWGNKILSNRAVIPQYLLRYSLPLTPLGKMTDEHVQEIVDRMMLRELFKLFFDFDEEQFRTDLFERAARIDADSDDVRVYEEGYYALTQELENPSRDYLRPKPPQKARNPRKTSKDNPKRAGNKESNE